MGKSEPQANIEAKSKEERRTKQERGAKSGSNWVGAAVQVAGYAVGGAVGAGAAWMAWSALAVNHRMRLPEAIEAERRSVETAGGVVSYYVDASSGGRPVVLLHSVNAAASAYEMRPLFEKLRGERAVYAPDLPGFGFSERRDRVYSPDLYVRALIDFVEREIGEPVDVVALSLTCEFVAIAALRRPELFRSVVFVSPTGFDETNERSGSKKVLKTVGFPVWSQAVFDLLVSRPSIRHYLKKSFEGPVDAGLAEYDFLTAHQPGARHAPFYFLSGYLFTRGIRSIYGRVTVPGMIIGNEDDFVSFEALPEFEATHPQWRVVRIAGAKSLPQFERPEAVVRDLVDFWQYIPVAAG